MKRTSDERRAFVAQAAAHMAEDMTPAEVAMWEILRPLDFQRQYPHIGFTKNGGEWHYIMDFYHTKLKLCVEVDGSSHRKKKGRDRRRDTRLAGEGIKTLRLSNQDALKRSAWVSWRVQTAMREMRE